MRRKLLIGLLLCLVLAFFSGCGPGRTGDGAGGSEGDPDGGTGSQGREPGEKPEIVFTAREMFSGEQINFPADFDGEAVFLLFYSYG